MVFIYGGFNRSALRAAAEPSPDPGPEPTPDPGPEPSRDWAAAPEGYSRVFFDDFSQQYTGNNSYQGVNQNKWEIGNRKSWFWAGEKTNVLVKPDGGLYTYGGRLPSVSSSDNTIEDDEVSAVRFASRQKVVKPGFNRPNIFRIYTEWEQRTGYMFAPWQFSTWSQVNVNGRVYDHGWEFDIEAVGSEYDPNKRTFVAHFNSHIWQRVPSEGGTSNSVMNPATPTIQLPDDPRAKIKIELRWRRGSDFYDPYQTFQEYWVEEVSGGAATGNMVRRYHFSPRFMLEYYRGLSQLPAPDDAPPADPLPPELAAVQPKAIWHPDSKLKNKAPWNSISANYGGVCRRPYAAGDDPSYTWFDVMKDSWVEGASGGLNWWNGFAKSAHPFSDSKPLYVSDYEDHHSHIDDHKCYSTVIWGVAAFYPD